MTPTPPALLDPSGVWFFNWVIPIAGGAILLLALADSVRRRRPTWGLLFLVNSLGVYWMETMGDWGQQLLYSPAFAEHHLLDWLPIKTPHDPVFMPFAYAVYWTVHALAVFWVAQLLMRRFGWSMLKSILVLAVPVNYAWDFFVEAIATRMGWWTYNPGFGPEINWGGGAAITTLWTIGLMSFWPNLIAYWAGKPPVGTLNHFERFFALERFTRPKQDVPATAAPGSTLVAQRVDARTLTRQQQYDAQLDYEVTIPRARFELYRFGAWFAVFQLSFFLLLIVPLVAMRVLTGIDGPYIP